MKSPDAEPNYELTQLQEPLMQAIELGLYLHRAYITDAPLLLVDDTRHSRYHRYEKREQFNGAPTEVMLSFSINGEDEYVEIRRLNDPDPAYAKTSILHAKYTDSGLEWTTILAYGDASETTNKYKIDSLLLHPGNCRIIARYDEHDGKQQRINEAIDAMLSIIIEWPAQELIEKVFGLSPESTAPVQAPHAHL
jgi:hypothetical protein